MGFSLFGGSKSTTVVDSRVVVEFAPEIGLTNVNVVDLEPIQKLVDNLAGVQLQTADVQAKGLAALAAGQRDVALAQREATDLSRGESSRMRDLLFLLAGGASLYALSRAKA